jgi:hypothetical protein
MFENLQSWLNARLSRRWFVGLALTMSICTVVFQYRNSVIGNPPDRELMYFDAEFIQGFCCSEKFKWPIRARMQFYIATQLTVDVVFPLAYSMLFGLALVALYSRPVSRWLLIFPVLALAFDLTENLATIYLVQVFECDLVPAQIPRLTQVFTPCKWTCVFVCIILVSCGLATHLTHRNQSRTGK